MTPVKGMDKDWVVHKTGCARTEGYYKIDRVQKANYKVFKYCKLQT